MIVTRFNMVWDDELTRLALEVAETFGDRALRSAMHRALQAADLRPRTDAGDVVFGEGLLEGALRTELLKLLRPH